MLKKIVLLAVVCFFATGCSVVGGKKLTNIKAFPDMIELTVGNNTKVDLMPVPAKAELGEVIWAVSNSSVLSVNEGRIIALKAGDCEITAVSKNNAEISCKINVKVIDEKSKEEKKSDSDDSNKGQKNIVVEQNINITDPNSFNNDVSQVYPSYYLSIDEVCDMEQSTIQYVINQIYAKNGYIFNSSSVQNIFKNYSWYHPITRNDPNFNNMDKANIELLSSYRKSNVKVASAGTIWTYYVVSDYMSNEYIKSLSQFDVNLCINTIYAKHGYIFKGDWKYYFEDQAWYNGKYHYDLSEKFTSTEHSNIDRLAQYR